MSNQATAKRTIRFWTNPEVYLILQGLPDDTVAKLTGRSYVSVSVKKNELKKKLIRSKMPEIGSPSPERIKEVIQIYKEAVNGIIAPEVNVIPTWKGGMSLKKTPLAKLQDRTLSSDKPEALAKIKKIVPEIVQRSNVPHKFIINGIEVMIDKGIKNVHIGLDSIKVDF